MVPAGCPAPAQPCSAPRARGDGPCMRWPAASRCTCSPRTRGWSRAGVSVRLALILLPAHAGMVPLPPLRWQDLDAAPRARGDGPIFSSSIAAAQGCSPRTRGWSPRAQHRLTSTDLLPRTRGWSRPAGPRYLRPRLLPAHAGMVPSAKSLTSPLLHRGLQPGLDPKLNRIEPGPEHHSSARDIATVIQQHRKSDRIDTVLRSIELATPTRERANVAPQFCALYISGSHQPRVWKFAFQ